MSGWHIRSALRRLGYNCSLIKWQNRREYTHDILLTDEDRKGLRVDYNWLHEAQKLVDRADVIIFKGDEPPARDIYKLRIPVTTPIAIVTSGSNFRRKALHPTAMKAAWDFDEYKIADLRFANSAEMAYPEAGFNWMPMTIDSRKKSNRIITRKRYDQPVRIAHSPSHRGRKGTKIFLTAMAVLQAKGYNFTVDIIESKPLHFCLASKKKATLFYDQNQVGFYGNSAIEAMQWGIPTFAWIAPAAYQQSGGILTRENNPIVDCGTDVESMVNAFEPFLTDPDLIKATSMKTKEYCDNVHSYEATGKRWEKELCAIVKQS
jgi:hypothetical protein